jgi:hypothetical protein
MSAYFLPRCRVGVRSLLSVIPDTEELRAAMANAGHVVVAACRRRHRWSRGRRPGRHPPAAVGRLCVHQVALVPHLRRMFAGFVVVPLCPCMHLLVAHHRRGGRRGSAHGHHVAAAYGATVAVPYPVVHDGVGAGAMLQRGVVDAAEAVHRRLPRREEVVRAGAQVQVVELLQAVRGRDHRVVLLLLAPPAWQRLRIRMVQAGGGARLERDGRPSGGGGGVIVRSVGRQGAAVAELRGDAADVVAHHAGMMLRGRGGLGLLEALGSAADGERAAVQDALHVVAAHVEVGDGVEAAELDRRDVVRLRRLLLRACIHAKLPSA